MEKKYQQWRELSIDPFKIKFKKIKLQKLISFPPAGNDVIESMVIINNKQRNIFIKIERSKMADFQSEKRNLNLLHSNYYKTVPEVLETCEINGKMVLALEKIDGDRLSDILSKNISSEEKNNYLLNYGHELSIIHNIPIEKFNDAKQRIINDYPKEENYSNIDNFMKPYISYLKNNKPEINYNCFIHGDFHYANILWKTNKVSGVLDFEYSGKGFKEQDIAWSLILRPTQCFMDNTNDIKNFLKGYKIKGRYDSKKLKWCLLNGYCHFYLMNMSNELYKNKLKKLIELVEIGNDL